MITSRVLLYRSRHISEKAMNPSVNQMAHRPSAAAQTAEGPQGTRPSPPGHAGLKCALSWASDNRLPREQAALAAGHTTTPTLACAQQLPALVLHKILSYLPVSAQGRCAQVCRHWESALPSPRLRLAHWLQQEAPASCRAHPGLGQGFRSRTLPFLQATRSPLLPIMTELHQEQQQRLSEPRPATQQEPPHPADCDLLSGLVHYSLNRQLTRTDTLRVQETSIDWPHAKLFDHFIISPCSRWIAFACQPNAQDPDCLRIYGWEQGHWQKQVLIPDLTDPVMLYGFTTAVVPDTLFYAQGRDILTWRRDPDSTSWHRTLVCPIPPSLKLWSYYSMADGDQVFAFVDRQEEGEVYLLGICPARNDSGWRKTLTVTYHAAAHAWAATRRSCQLAISVIRFDEDSDAFINEVHVWRKGLDSSHPEQWNPQVSELPGYTAEICGLTYSPDGHYLLGILTNGQAVLWALDARCRLQERLTLHGCILEPGPCLSMQCSFSSDEKQLALPCSPGHIQLCYSDDSGHWHYGPLLETPPGPGNPAQDKLVNMRLSSNGRTLVQRRKRRLDIWHQDPVEGWQHFAGYKHKRHHHFFPQYCLLEPGNLVCTTAQDPELSLKIHGPDSQGRLVTKACIAVDTPLNGPAAASPDGLSLMLASVVHPPTLLQLIPPADNEAVRKAPQESMQEPEAPEEPAQEQQEPAQEPQEPIQALQEPEQAPSRSFCGLF